MAWVSQAYRTSGSDEPSLLAYKGPNGRTSEEVPCGDGRYVWCSDCGLTIRARCRRNSCWWCGPINARQVSRAIALAGPERSYLLTLAGMDWQEVREKVKRWRYRIRKAAGPGFADCWHVEPNPQGSGQHHVHGLAHGPFVPVETLRAAAIREGFGSWVGIKRIRSLDRASYYGVKLAALAAAAYGVKGVDTGLEAFLEANGGRMVHASRGFWREPVGSGFSGLRGVRAAVSAARWREREERCPVTGEPHSWSGEGFGPGTGWDRYRVLGLH